MKNHKKLFSLLLVLCLLLSVGTAAYAAAGGFPVTYRPGTSDTVTNMPAADSGVGGQPYTVSSTVPQREGYEFLGWTLDYGVANTYTLTYQVIGDPTYGVPGDTAAPDPVTGIREGSNLTLVEPLTTAWKTTDGKQHAEVFKVRYLEVGTDQELAPAKIIEDQAIGTVETEDAIDIGGYVNVGAFTQSYTIQEIHHTLWGFDGWFKEDGKFISELTDISADTTVYGRWRCFVEELYSNEIVFYYEKLPTVLYTDYTVSYIDIDTGDRIIPDATREHCEVGSTQTESIPDVAGYMFVFPSGGEVASDRRTVTFKIEDDLICDPITGNRIELYYLYL